METFNGPSRKPVARTANEEYHHQELKIALDPSHPDHILPPALPTSKQVLDIGCGAGQTLMAAYSDRRTVGLDYDLEALRFGHTLTSTVDFVCGKAEELPLPDGRFDLVIARVSLAYTDINDSLKEIRRVLRDDGQIWITLHPFALVWEQAKHANHKGWLFFLYVIANGICFRVLQKQFRWFGRNESFQTEKGIMRALQNNRFGNINIQRNRHFLVTANCK